jgi:hypothetical protein
MILFQEYKKATSFNVYKNTLIATREFTHTVRRIRPICLQTLVHFVLVFRSAKNQELNLQQ